MKLCMKIPAHLATLLACAALGGCATERLTRADDAYHAQSSDAYYERVSAQLVLKVSCAPEPSSAETKVTTRPCLYRSVDESHLTPQSLVDKTQPTALSSYFANCTSDSGECAHVRNRVIDVLVKVSNDNCAAFLQRTFLTKSTSDSVYNFGRDLLTGGAAAVAVASPPSAVGLSLGNLMLRSYESFNRTFFLSEAFQSIENAINLARSERRTELDTRCRGTRARPDVSYGECSIHTALTQVKEYGDACSLRVGVNKLQSLVHQGRDQAKFDALSEKNKILEKDIEDKTKALKTLQEQDRMGEVSKRLQEINDALVRQQRKFEERAGEITPLPQPVIPPVPGATAPNR